MIKYIIAILIVLLFFCCAPSLPCIMVDRVEDAYALHLNVVKIDTVYIHQSKYYKVYYK